MEKKITEREIEEMEDKYAKDFKHNRIISKLSNINGAMKLLFIRKTIKKEGHIRTIDYSIHFGIDDEMGRRQLREWSNLGVIKNELSELNKQNGKRGNKGIVCSYIAVEDENGKWIMDKYNRVIIKTLERHKR